MPADVAMPHEVYVAAEKSQPGTSLLSLEEVSDHQKRSFTKTADVENILGSAPQFYDSAAESELPPEVRFQALTEGITTAEDYADKRDDMVDVISDQMKLTDEAKTAFEEHPAMDILIPQSQQEYDKVLDAVRVGNPELLKNPAFMKLLHELPSAVYSNNPQAANVFATLMDSMNVDGQNALVSFADKILKIQDENPELIAEYRKSYDAYADEAKTESMMWQILNELDDRFTKGG